MSSTEQSFLVDSPYDAIDNLLVDYSKTVWDDNSHKLEAIKIFQDNWDIEAEDFCEMLTRSLSGTGKLMDSANFFPRRMITTVLAKEAPEVARSMFRDLFDETRDFADRVEEFKENSDKNFYPYLGDRYSHYQTENIITTYLWLHNPDKYYIYKISYAKEVSNAIGLTERGIYDFKSRKGTDKKKLLKDFYELYDSIRDRIELNTDLIELYKVCIADKEKYYQDPELITLTIDFGYYVYDLSKTKKSQDKEDTSSSDPEPIDDSEGPADSVVQEENETEDIHLVEGIKLETYSKEKFLEEVFMPLERYEKLRSVLMDKQNIILQGAPGVGKTHIATLLACSIMGVKDESRVGMVQFHQNYSYDDFVIGYRPTETNFEIKEGVFYKFCKAAREHKDQEYFFIIDEINRGNMSKIFGELFMQIEKGYRDKEVNLPIDGRRFSVPSNLYIIGTMNTADRSLAFMDYALRRRFSFFELTPGFDTERFKEYQHGLGSEPFDDLIKRVKSLNDTIINDKSLGKGFCIGHSYFANWTTDECTLEKISNVVEYEILPMLEEYWFDNPDKYKEWKKNFSSFLIEPKGDME